MSNEGIINVSLDEADKWLVYSPFEETAKYRDVLALYTKALAFMDTLVKESITSGEFQREVGDYLKPSEFKPFSVPFIITSDGSNDTSFEVVFPDKDYTALNKAFGQISLKEKRKEVKKNKAKYG